MMNHSAKNKGTPEYSVSELPVRDEIASKLDKAKIAMSLFERQLEPIKIGRFILLEPIGSGGMSEVYAAYDEQLDRKVAIKLVSSRRRSSQAEDERLLREAKILARISHPNVVHVYEVGYIKSGESSVFIAMEFIRGKTLQSWLRDHAEQRASRQFLSGALRMFVAAGRGLEAVHNEGLAHRDFKPSNVLVDDGDRIKVIDFGLARFINAPTDQAKIGKIGTTRGGTLIDENGTTITLTSEGQFLGTPCYMAPEQLRGEVADSRSDQFSFCVALYEALYQKRPFFGENIKDLLLAILHRKIDVAHSTSEIPPVIRKALLRGLAPDPQARFPNMGELLTVVEDWGRQQLGISFQREALSPRAPSTRQIDGLSISHLSEVLGVTAEDLAHLTSATSADSVEKLFQRLLKLLHLMGLGEQEIRLWMRTRLPSFGETPIDVLRAGRGDELISRIMTLASGNIGA